jgi:deazaflavin-dependent oxidoreductase (nitroreductase family)
MADVSLESRKHFQWFNYFMMFMWRLGLGPYINAWPEVGGQIMVLNHFGRRTGKRLQTPLNYAEVNGEIYCLAGFGRDADWYKNIIANPQVEVWLPNGWWAGLAEEVLDEKLRLPLIRQVILASGAAAPIFRVEIGQLNDDQLAEVTASYNLVRIRRTVARTGPGGPGDLAGIWPLATLLLLLALLGRRRRKGRR